jgi:hypothetical protein
MNITNEIATLICELFSKYPPILQIPLVAAILKEDVPTIRARIRRGSFQMTVRQDPGGRQYVLLLDLVRFVTTGETQPQPVMRAVRQPRNPLGLSGKRKPGRPTKSDQYGNQNQNETSSANHKTLRGTKNETN